ncbi:hypothetical protein LZZ85_14735 [Terrimonas sp. NA20]|uniref:TonB-dependent receptor n=1 Tax=Terrimonas ginsenosidimutans TaxID=2908004 RepID=A0ABS9KT87_9BACT|nr:hypothetical protein [Terrimonas ginsenosidimutans]MCG2615554.1 hypothetical protein [Terrimonas ginsenosidimutans]
MKDQKKEPAKEIKKDTIPAGKHDHDMSGHGHTMSHAFSLNLPMNRNGSGTSWLPDETPMYMYMTGKKAMWMFHGNVFLRYTNTDIFNKGIGSDKFDAPNWFMAMMNKRIGKRGLFTTKAMISLDPLTEGGGGYPLLFQSGETHNGARLVNRQHPHDLFAELSVAYTHAINKNTDVFGYFGYPGEPAISAPAFMHRISAMNNPDAPLGHHWQDATHITFGVGTLGFRYKKLKVEGSIFTGREPNEERYGFDKMLFNSYSYRLSYNASRNWAFQFSQGFIKEPELLEPGVDVTRTTASALYAKKLGKDRDLNAALIWGFNDKGAGHKEHSLLLEENYRFGRNAVYSRYEWVQKSTEELELENQLGHQTFDVQVFSAGYNRGLWKSKVVDLAAGAQATLNFPAAGLKSVYGNLPVGFQVYVQLRPVLQR